MSITTYAELSQAVENWLHRDGDTDIETRAPEFIRLGELRIYRDLRIRAMETSLSSAIASGVVAVPTGYIDMKFAYLNTTPVTKLQRKDAEWIYYNYPTRSADSQPKFFAREGENFIFGPYPDSASYTMKGIYYKRLDALSASNTTNWFMTNAPDLLLWAALAEAEPFVMNDQRATMWEAKYEMVKSRIQREDDQEDFSGSPLTSTVR
jgi:hypothetical protein